MKDNKLLAEYIGGKLHSDSPTNKYIFPKRITRWEYNWLHEHEWVPDKCWNQLMEVVDKIDKESGLITMSIMGQSCIMGFWNKQKQEYSDIKEHGKTKIESVYAACVEYIKSK